VKFKRRSLMTRIASAFFSSPLCLGDGLMIVARHQFPFLMVPLPLEPRNAILNGRHQPPRNGIAPQFDEYVVELSVRPAVLNGKNIWRPYNRGTVVKQVIEELKND
jgi:hypothetical protein